MHGWRARRLLRAAASRSCLVLLALGAAAPADDFDAAQPTTWRIPDPDLHAVSAREDLVWAVGYWGAVLRSEDGGGSWSYVETPTSHALFDVSFADRRHGWAVGEQGTVLRTTDGGLTWRLQPVEVADEAGGLRPLEGALFGVAALSSVEAWAVGDLGVVIRLRDGETWQPVRLPEDVFHDDETPERIFNAVRFSDPAHGWIVGEFGTVLRTRDGGRTWTGRREFRDAPDDLYLFDVAVADGQRAAVAGLAGTVLVTEDGGATWRPRNTGTSAPLYGISLSSSTAVVGDRGVMFTEPAGEPEWIQPERPRMFNWLGDVTSAGGGRLYTVGEKGAVLRSEDGGAHWVQIYGRKPPPFGGISVPPPGPAPEGPAGPVLIAPEAR